MTVHLSAPARAITPGQAIVIYSGTDVVSGGWINRTLPA
ncbi:MAG: aminomethyltransferase beta-barrel domain-containing protein [Myxococcota bacterium]|nr:aminomethyltransferase beta-barrel domain-containing protein [Myxococcota bacterium]